MKFCKTFVLTAMVFLFLAGSSLGQITIPYDDIPTTPGDVMRYHIFADTSEGVPINLGEAAGNQLWDFTGFVNENITVDSLFLPAAGPSGELFEGSERGIYSYGFMGLDFGNVYRYEGIEDTAWTIDGLVLDVVIDTLTGIPVNIPLPLPEPIKMAPLPMTYEDSWSLDDSIHYVYTEDSTGLEFLIVLEYGGFNGFDAWGTVQYPGGEAECLRMHANIGGIVNVYPIFMGVPLPIPIFTQELAVTNAYMWLAPDLGELATVVTMPDTTGENEIAAMVRIRTTQTSEVVDPSIAIPITITLSPAYPNPFNAATRFNFNLPSGQNVNVSVFDVMGRHVQTLGSGYKTSGQHVMGWDASELSSGTYFIRLSTADQVQSRKVILLK